MREFLISTKVPAFESGLEDRPGAKVTERADRRAAPDLGVDRDGVRVDLGAASRPACGRGGTTNGWMVTSGSSSTSGSIQVVAGSTIVTPASMWRSLIRSRSTAAASASSTRVLTPSASNGSARDVHGDRLAVLDEEARSRR